MYKIRLLILLLTSSFLFSCAAKHTNQNNVKFSIGAIGGEYDGLLLSHLLSSHLKAFGLFSNQSSYEVRASISHTTDLFITNIDNTSDRESITSIINLNIYSKNENCFTYAYNNQINQFFIYASSDKFLSNQKAIEKIKHDNTEILVKKFINDVQVTPQVCSDEKK